MPTRQGFNPVLIPQPLPQYGEGNERQFRNIVQQQLQALAAGKAISLPMYEVADFGGSVAQGYDDTDAITKAITAVDGAGGGLLLFPGGTTLIGADIECPRSVMPVGLGSDKTILKSTDGTQRRFKVTGSTVSLTDLHVIQGMMFDAVSVDYGTTSGDTGRGGTLAFCALINSDRAVYYGYHTYNTKIVGCNFRLNQQHVYYDFATAGSDSGAHMCISDSVLSEATSEALYMNGSTIDGYHLYLNNVIFDSEPRALKTVGVTHDGLISIKNVTFEGLTDCFIDNDGANVLVEGFMALTAIENYWVYQHGANTAAYTMWKDGRASWNNNKLVRIESGLMIVDQPSIFINSPLWGAGLNQFHHASSSGGKVMAERVGLIGRHGVSVGTIDSGTPVNTATVAAVPYDYNDRVYEFDVDCNAAGATANQLRVQLADGGASPFIDLTFPNVSGGAHVRVRWTRGGTISASCCYAPSGAPGNSQWVRNSTADTTALGAVKTLAFTTIGVTPSAITISDLHETINGHQVTGL